MQAMVDYHWPGNIRALRHAIERAVILSESTKFDAADLQIDKEPVASTRSNKNQHDDRLDAELNLERLEKRAIQQALNSSRYNISHAARELGLTRAALYRRMEKHNI